MNKKKSILSNNKLFQKLKGVKHIEIIIAIVFGAIMLLIYFSSFESSTTNTYSNDYQKTDIVTYGNYLEDKLENVLSTIEGAGTVNVMLTFESGAEYIYANTVEENKSSASNGGTNTSNNSSTSSPILIDVNGKKEPIVLKEIMPTLEGVVIISSGAKNTKVKLDLLKAVQTLLDVPTSKIEILVGND